MRSAVALLCLALACGTPAPPPVTAQSVAAPPDASPLDASPLDAAPPDAAPPDAAPVAQSLGGKTKLGVAEQVKDGPKWIGVLFKDRSNQIRDVLAASPAARAGMRPGDKVLSIGGTPVSGLPDVIAVVRRHAAGATMEVVIERAGVKTTLKVVVENRPDMAKVQSDKLLGKRAPGVTLKTLDGKTFKLSDHKGKVVLIDFWATWCKPCTAALPHLLAWNAKLGPRGLVVVGVTDEDAETVQPYVTENNIPYPIPLDTDRDAWRDYLVEGLPTTVIIDKAGIVRFVEPGYAGPGAIQKLLEKLLK